VYLLLLGQCTQVLVDKIKQDTTWVMVSESFDPILLFKLNEKYVLKQSDNQYKMAVLIAHQLSILSFCQDNQVPHATYYNQFTTRVEVAFQAGVCYYTPDLLDTKCVELSCTEYETLTPAKKKNVRGVEEQEYLAYLFINNSNQKLHSQLKKDVANNYSKGNMEAYPSDIQKGLTLLNEYMPLKLDAAPVPTQGMAFATTSCKSKRKKASGGTKYISNSNWKPMSPEAQTKAINTCKKAAQDDDNEKSSASAKSAKTIKSISKTMESLEQDNRRLKISVNALHKCKEDDDNDLSISFDEGLSHFQKAIKFLEESYPEIALALKSKTSLNLDVRCVLLLDNQSTFDLCCNRGFMSMIRKASCALNMTCDGAGLKITQQGKFPGYTFWVWFSKKAITNIVCLKKLIKIYRVTHDSKVEITFVVHCQQFSLTDLFFEMHPCGLHICCTKKMGEFGFIKTVKHNMRLF
jgi:hypothetical protein